jgi:predicted DNA-binding transcriptional regulator AlpA
MPNDTLAKPKTRRRAPADEVYTAKDLARMLRISERTVWRMRDSGRLPKPLQFRHVLRWPRAVVDDWLARGCPAIAKSR